MGEHSILRYNYMISMRINTQQMPGQIFLTWSAPIQHAVQRTWRWYTVAASVTGLLLLYSVWTQAWTFTLLIVLIAIIYGWSMRRAIPTKTISIGEYGVQLGTDVMGWNECAGYWLLQGENYVELHFERSRGKPRSTKILVGQTNIQDIRAVLSAYTNEFTDRIERPLDTISRLLKI